MPMIRRYVGVPSVLGALALVFATVLASPAAQAKKDKPPDPDKDRIVEGTTEDITGTIKGDLYVQDDGVAVLDDATVKGSLIVRDGGEAVLDGDTGPVLVKKDVVVNQGGTLGGDAALTTLIEGSVNASECLGFTLNNAIVGGDVDLIRCGGQDPGSRALIIGVDIMGKLIVRGLEGDTGGPEENHPEYGSWAVLDGVTVDKDLTVTDGGHAALGCDADETIVCPGNPACDYCYQGVTVSGSVNVETDALLQDWPAGSSTIQGSVVANDCDSFRLVNANVGGDVSVRNCGGSIYVSYLGGGAGGVADLVVDILGSTIDGNVTYQTNHGPILAVGVPGYPNVIGGDLAFTDNDIGGNAEILRNSSGSIFYISNNSITQDLECAENDPLPLGVETNTVGGTTMCEYQTP